MKNFADVNSGRRKIITWGPGIRKPSKKPPEFKLRPTTLG